MNFHRNLFSERLISIMDVVCGLKQKMRSLVKQK